MASCAAATKLGKTSAYPYSSYLKSTDQIENPSSSNSLGKTYPEKEAEVDHLTNILIQCMENSSDPRFVGICAKCGKKVIERGCKAMEQLFHSQCFTCTKCKKELSGKPFYSMDGKPYCEEDYLNMLEKCAVCERPILDKILRALDKSYHPSCFTCVTCDQCLDGVPFTSDKNNNIYCIKDYQRKYAPQCWGCKKLIVPESGREEVKRILAMGHNYHPNCYRCEDCGLQLSSQKEGHECYPLDSQALCFKCHTQRRRLHAPGSTARA